MSKNELLPCPFCGGTEIKVKRMKWNNLTDWYYATCKKCTANVRHFNEVLLIAKWNERTLPKDIYTIRITPEILEQMNTPIDD